MATDFCSHALKILHFLLKYVVFQDFLINLLAYILLIYQIYYNRNVILTLQDWFKTVKLGMLDLGLVDMSTELCYFAFVTNVYMK